MIIDNFELIKSLLSFNSSDEFYMIQILQRGKDQQNAKSSSEVRVIKTYFINSFDYLDNRKEEIIKLCEIFNARAYINLNKKNFKQISMKGLELMSHLIAHEEYHKFRTLFESACGQSGACDGNKMWIIDIDTKNEKIITEIEDIVNQCEPLNKKKIINIIPTVNGYHFITTPFNKQKFKDLCYNNFDVHDNNPTLLYFNKI